MGGENVLFVSRCVQIRADDEMEQSQRPSARVSAGEGGVGRVKEGGLESNLIDWETVEVDRD